MATFPKSRRLLKKADFRFDRHKSECFYGPLFKALVRKSEGERLGISASRRTGNAVSRNLAKRLIREWFRQSKEKLDHRDVLIILRHKFSRNEKNWLNKELQRLVSWAK